MKVIEDGKDRRGISCMWFSSFNLKEIHEWLFTHYQGYKFAVILDETIDEYETMEKPVPVYFLDVALDEVADYAGKRVVKNDST